MKKNATPETGGSKKNFDGSRRDAIRKIGLAAAAPLILPSRLVAQKTAKSDTPPPSERLSVGLIGLGRSMDRHSKVLLTSDEVFVHAVCDVSKQKTKSYEVNVRRAYRKEISQFGSCLATQDHREIMSREDIDAVVIATPVHWHAAITLDAIRSGKDVLCQAPLTLTVAEGQLVESAAKRHGAVVQCAAPLRGEDQLIETCELVRNGYLGKIKEIYVEMKPFKEPDVLPPGTPPADFNYDRWLGPAPDAPYDDTRVASSRIGGWRQYWEYGVRHHGEVGFSRYDIIQWELGTEASGPVEFVPAGFNGAAYASFSYKDGPQVLLGHPTERDKDIEFVGEAGRLNVSSRGQMNTEPTDIENVKFAGDDVRFPMYDTIEGSWIDAVKSRRTPLVDAGIGHRSSTICHLAAIAERLERRIEWDPVKQEIVGDPIASRMLNRPRRAPYTLS